MNKTLFWRLFFPVFGVVVLALVGIGFYMPVLVKDKAEAAAVEQARNTVAQFKAIRAYYTTNVISKVLGKDGLKGSFNHRNEPNSIPLPATMIHDLSQLLRDQGTVLRLYSAYPFPNRSSRQLDDFQRSAWDEITRNPEQPYVRTVEIDGKHSVRVGVADLMVAEACVDCHNSHPDTPKNDWQMGDVRGVLEIETSIDAQLAAGAELSWTLNLMILAGSVLTFVSLYLVYRHNIGKRLETVAAALEEIAEGDGDLTRRLNAEGEHEVARIGKAFNGFIDKLGHTLVDVRDVSAELSSVSAQLSQASRETSDKIVRQDSETQQVATAISEMEMTAREIAGSASSVAGATDETAEATRLGGQVVQSSVDSTRRLADDIGRAAEALSQLQADSDNISGVLDVIRGIAEQTNLLALNAAIEAARAGEQGRGFAVVADEVRTLAGRTQESTQEIQEMTERLRSATKSVVQAMGQSREQAESTVGLAGEVGQHLENISQSVDTLRDMAAQIATAAAQQGAVVGEVHRNINGISDASQAVSAAGQGSNQQAAGAEQLSQRLQQLVGHFKFS